MNICIVAGARPNFMKVAPIVHSIEKAKGQGRDINYQLVYAGREDDPTLEGTLFDDLQLARPQVYLGVDCENLNDITGQVVSAFDRYLQAHPTDVVLVVDDLASTLATAIVTKKKGILLAHLVAGTRSFDIDMPKEINRLVTDMLSDLLFTAGMQSNSIATREGAELSKIYMVGNILMDTLRFNHTRFVRPALLAELQLHHCAELLLRPLTNAWSSWEAQIMCMWLVRFRILSLVISRPTLRELLPTRVMLPKKLPLMACLV